MKTLAAKHFNLKATIESGQLFRWHYDSKSGFYYVVAGSDIIKLRQKGSIIEHDSLSQEFNVKKFFGLNQNYPVILRSISRDEKIAAAIKSHHGLRILEQDFWECAASFICSSFSNIPRIRQCIGRLAAAFGEKIEFDGFSTSSFPQPHQIGSFSKLEQCGLGYRAKYLFETAAMFANSPEEYSPQSLRKLSYADAKEKVMELPGVGNKVADCILLFSCGFFEAFPVDVWIHRAVLGSYGSDIDAFMAAAKTKAKAPSESVVADFARDYFGKYAGYAQQFIYHNAKQHNSAMRNVQSAAADLHRHQPMRRDNKELSLTQKKPIVYSKGHQFSKLNSALCYYLTN
ncbi:MAG TPA: DNA glycosylase [Candidatus Nanoarchaeia archaeon]|nr:DNA glycosylase [Candidatus Nanoarchaeia archaeon]